jgi:hypothetical protein
MFHVANVLLLLSIFTTHRNHHQDQVGRLQPSCQEALFYVPDIRGVVLPRVFHVTSKMLLILY